MKIVIQRVSEAKVEVDGRITGAIGNGLLLLAGFGQNDTEEVVDRATDKILKMRIFEDSDGKMNRSVVDLSGELLVVSQFTLYGDTRKGNRPAFTDAMPPDRAESLYEFMICQLKSKSSLLVETGVFGAMMSVEMVNRGPVTLIVEM
ncbi:MAG: D-aminoacyl-tRNA deacylase [Balneolaceae bacterium]